MKIALGISLLLAWLQPVCGQTSRSSPTQSDRGLNEGTLVREILEVKRQYDVAQLGNDAKWFERMLAQDYVFIAPDGVLSTKADFVDDMQSRNLVGSPSRSRT